MADLAHSYRIRTSPAVAPAYPSFALRVCDVPLVVKGLPPPLGERFSALMRPFVVELGGAAAPTVIEVCERPDGELAIVRDGRVVAAYGDANQLLQQLEWHVVTAALEGTSAYASIHGAAFVRGTSAVMLVAESGAGKTTITLGMMRRGWEPLSDDIVLIDAETLAIQPFPRCFHVDGATRELALDESLVEWPGAIPGYARPLRWATSGVRPTAVLLAERCQTCFSRLRAVTLAEVAGALGVNAIRSGLPRPQLARVAVRIAAEVSHGGRLLNARLEDTLDLIEEISQR